MALLQATWEVVQPGYTLKPPGPEHVLFLWSSNKQNKPECLCSHQKTFWASLAHAGILVGQGKVCIS